MMDPWILAQKICKDVTDGGMSATDLFKCFNTYDKSHIMTLSFEEALKKYKNYQEQKELESFISFCQKTLSNIENVALAMDGNTNFQYSCKDIKELINNLYNKYLTEKK